MSAPTVPAPGGQDVFTADGGTRAERLGGWWRKHRFWLIAGVLFVAVTTAGLVIGLSGERTGGELSITNPAPAGAQAAAAVLGWQGVNVKASDSLASTLESLAANGPANSTVLVFDPNGLLKPSQLAELAAAAGKAQARTVAVTPGPLAAKNLGTGLSSAGTATAGSGPVAANCSNADAVAAGALALSGASVPAPGGHNPPVNVYRGAETCFPADGKPGSPGIMASSTAGDVTVLGTADVVNNDGLARQGNAALAFRLLGSRPHLVWYTASLKDVPVAAQPPSLAALTPQWILPASAWLLLVAVIGMFWRGRRHGPLVGEPLPVIVKASETVTGRARLYQDARAVDTAARSLQHATLTRLAQRLRLGTSADPRSVVDAAAERTGRPRQGLAALMVGNVPRNEQEMLTMAAQLAALEEEVAQR